MKKLGYRLFLNIFVFVSLAGSSFSEEENLNLSLQDAMDYALRSNLDISVERYTPEIAQYDVQKNWGVFDPALSVSLKHQESDTPLAKQYSIAAGGLSAIESEDTTFKTQLGGKLPTGTLYALDFNSVKNSSTFNQFDPEYIESGTLSLTQPLLKDGWFNSNLAFIRISKNRYASSKLQFQQTLINVITEVELAYWDYVFAIKNLEVKRESLKLSQSLLEQNQVKVKVGTLAELEVVQSEAGVALRKEALLDAEQAIKNQENRLKKIIFDDMASHRLDKLSPVDEPLLDYAPLSTLERIQAALENRLDLQQAKIDLANENIFLRYYQNQRLPRIDLEGSLGLNGLGGSFSDGFSNVTNQDHPLWSTGIVLKYPLGNRTEGANVNMSKLQVKKKLLQIKKIENDIVSEMDTGTSQLETLWKKIEATSASERFARAALEAEQKKYEAGVSTSHSILDFEEDLAITQSNKLIAEINYLKGAAELERLQGTTLKNKKIMLIDE